jgi:hypothetical protein
MRIVLFTRNGGKLPSIPIRDGLEFLHVPFESSDLNNLMLIAKYKILNYPTSLVLDSKGKVLLKVRGALPTSYVDSILQPN